VKQRLVLAAMVVVTAWSLWAFGQAKRPTSQPTGVISPARSAALAHTAAPTQAAAPAVALPQATPSVKPPAAKPEAKAEGNEAKGGGNSDAREEEAESEELPAFNLTEFGTKTPPYVAMLINFGILVAGYYLIGRKPVASALQSRRDEIAKEIDEAQRMRKEAEQRAKMYQGRLEKLEEEVRIAREGLIRAGEAERDRIIAEAEAKADRMRRDAEFLVEQEVKQIRHDLLRDTVEAAVSAAEELLKKRVTATDQERLAEDYLADLGGKKGSAEGARSPRAELGEPS
jgi:F-type H+-transporting ATPase subunit b